MSQTCNVEWWCHCLICPHHKRFQVVSRFPPCSLVSNGQQRTSRCQPSPGDLAPSIIVSRRVWRVAAGAWLRNLGRGKTAGEPPYVILASRQDGRQLPCEVSDSVWLHLVCTMQSKSARIRQRQGTALVSAREVVTKLRRTSVAPWRLRGQTPVEPPPAPQYAA